MVLEKAYSTSFLLKYKYSIFFISFIYSIFGIAGSLLLFSNFNKSAIALALIALILLASLRKIFTFDEVSTKNFVSLVKEKIIIYFNIYFGILLCFALFSIVLPEYATANIFETQYNQITVKDPTQIYSNLDITQLLKNNIAVLISIFMLSFLFGITTFFLIILIWNASLLGVVFGVASTYAGLESPSIAIFIFVLLLFSTLIHVILEIMAYLIGGILGESLSKKLIEKNISLTSIQIVSLFLFAVLLLVIAALSEVYVAPYLISHFISVQS